MRHVITSCFLLLVPSVSFAQTKEMVEAIEAKLSTLKYVHSLETPTGGFKPYADGETALRPTSAAVRAIKYLGGEVPHPDKHIDLVMKCYDPVSGGFSDKPGGKPDVFVTSLGVMAAVELGIPKEKFRKAMDFLKENAKNFEDVRIGAAAVEAWGVKDCPFDLKAWFEIANQEERVWSTAPPAIPGEAEKPTGMPRLVASKIAFDLRLGKKRSGEYAWLPKSQREDGGWGRDLVKESDLESTYRVMRALHLLKEKPKDVAKLRAFVAACRNKDGGYGVKPGEKSGVSGVYYVAVITKWLDEME